MSNLKTISRYFSFTGLLLVAAPTAPDGCSTGRSVCGDGRRDANEACDGADLPGSGRCELYNANFVGGTLSCTNQCDIDLSTCLRPVCGDGSVHPSESCDGADLRGNTCESVNPRHYSGGELRCDPKTCFFDASGCLPPVCGDGKVQYGEFCDGANWDGHDRACDWTRYAGGQLTCTADCLTDDSACIPYVCGNGVREGLFAEQCDGEDFFNGVRSCREYDPARFLGGQLSCRNCQIDTSSCDAAVCGDGAIEAGEACDGANLAGQSCVTQYAGELYLFGARIPVNFAGGTLGCTGACSFDMSQCQLIPGCYWQARGIVCYPG